MEDTFLPKITTIKNEIDDDLDRSADRDCTIEDAENKTIFPEPNTKCGEILFGHKGTFTLVCAVCAKFFNSLEEFGVHIQDMHITLKELYEHLVIEAGCIETVKDAFAENKEFIQPELTESNDNSGTDSNNETETQQLANDSNTSKKCSSQQTEFKREALVCKLCSRAYTDHKSYLIHAKRAHGILTSRMRNNLRRQSRRRIRDIGDDLKENAKVMENKAELEAYGEDKNEFPCNLCKSRYSHKRSLQAHMRKKHANGNQPKEDIEVTENISESEHSPVEKDANGDEPKEDIEVTENMSESEQSRVEKDANGDEPKEDIEVKENISESEHSLVEKDANDDEPKEDIEVKENISESEHSLTEKEIKLFSCPLCISHYSHRRSLLAHFRKKHSSYSVDDLPDLPPEIPPPRDKRSEEYLCHICERIYTIKASLNKHIRTVHMKKRIAPRPRACRYCNKCFDDLEALKLHVKDDHPGDKKYVCPHCPKLFKCNTTLKGHIFTHTGERPYKCAYCPWAFSHSSNLSMHIKIHLDIKKHPCSMCGKRFISGTEKRRHERTHTGEKLHQCEECGKRYNSAFQLTEHKRRHKNIRNYECEICEKRFYTPGMLREHMATHNKARPFSCSVCGQSFPRRKALKVHEQLHSDVKKYTCEACGKAFAQYAGLYAHRKSHGVIN